MTWYSANTGNEQGLIIDEETGRNVAVTYDKKDAALIAAAPELLAALQFLLQEYNQHIPEDCDCVKIVEAYRQAQSAIQKAKGE